MGSIHILNHNNGTWLCKRLEDTEIDSNVATLTTPGNDGIKSNIMTSYLLGTKHPDALK